MIFGCAEGSFLAGLGDQMAFWEGAKFGCANAGKADLKEGLRNIPYFDVFRQSST
jgi:hypothetical protein